MAIKAVGTQIHFLSDVLVAVESLDLKVPITYLNSQSCHPASLGRLKQYHCIWKW